MIRLSFDSVVCLIRNIHSEYFLSQFGKNVNNIFVLPYVLCFLSKFAILFLLILLKAMLFYHSSPVFFEIAISNSYQIKKESGLE